MINPSFDLMRHNLLEIYDAVVTLPNQPLSLVAWENKLYSVNTSWIGRRIVFINSVVKLFKCDSQMEQVKIVVQKTHTFFEEYKSTLSEHIAETERALKDWQRGEQENLDQFKTSFRRVLSFQEAAWPFLKLVFHQNPRLKGLLTECLNSEHTFFHDEELVKRIKRLSQIYRLVIHSGGSLPLKAFIKALTMPQLPEEDLEDIQHWIHEMKFFQGTINNRLVSKGLLALVDFLNQGNRRYHAEDIEAYVLTFHEDYRLPDAKHIAWRNSLNLNSQLCPKVEGFDNTIAFKRPDDTVLVIAQNRAALRIRNHVRTHRSEMLYGPKPYQYLHIDPKGRFAIAPLLRPISHPQPITGLVKWLVKQPVTPKDLKFEYLAIDPSGLLVSVKNHAQDTIFNYRSIEDLIYAFVGKNIELYQRIVNETGLIDLPHAGFFRDSLLKGFFQENFTPKELVNNYSPILRHEDIAQAETLYQQARQIALETRQELIALEIRHDPALVDTIWKQEIKKWWNYHCLAGRLWPTFKSDLTCAMEHRLTRNC